MLRRLLLSDGPFFKDTTVEDLNNKLNHPRLQVKPRPAFHSAPRKFKHFRNSR